MMGRRWDGAGIQRGGGLQHDLSRVFLCVSLPSCTSLGLFGCQIRDMDMRRIALAGWVHGLILVVSGYVFMIGNSIRLWRDDRREAFMMLFRPRP